MYIGMNANTGQTINDIDHIKQSIQDILITPIGSRVMRRDYGSLLFQLLDQPQNDVTTLKLFSAIYSALLQHEPRIQISAIDVYLDEANKTIVELTATLNQDKLVNLQVEVASC